MNKTEERWLNTKKDLLKTLNRSELISETYIFQAFQDSTQMMNIPIYAGLLNRILADKSKKYLFSNRGYAKLYYKLNIQLTQYASQTFDAEDYQEYLRGYNL